MNEPRSKKSETEIYHQGDDQGVQLHHANPPVREGFDVQTPLIFSLLFHLVAASFIVRWKGADTATCYAPGMWVYGFKPGEAVFQYS